MKSTSFNVLELREDIKEGRIVSRDDRKRHANCIEEDAKDEKRYKPEVRVIKKEDEAKIVKETTKNIQKPQDATKLGVLNLGELYLTG